MTVTTLVATVNAPQRGGEANNDRAFERLADQGHTVLAGQEIPDADVRRLCPKGWRRHRGPARSEVLYWDPDEWEHLGRGAVKISSPNRTPRYVLWVLLRHRRTGVVRRFACVHLVAFKTSRNGPEYRHQARRLAAWIEKHPRAVVMGDFNGSFGGKWLAPVEKVANDHTPKTESGPDGQNIDLIVTNKQIPRATHARTIPGPGDHDIVSARLPLTRKAA